jgi:hypothetical protein
MTLYLELLFATTMLIVRNQRIHAAWNARQQDNARRAAKGLPPRTSQGEGRWHLVRHWPGSLSATAGLPQPRRRDPYPDDLAVAFKQLITVQRGWRDIRHELDRMHLVTLATADHRVHPLCSHPQASAPSSSP